MDLVGHPKWPSNLGHDHGGHVCSIVYDILLLNIDTFLEKIFKRRGEGPLSKRCIIEIPHQKSNLAQ
jgi:hypothetical protein